LRLPLRGRPPSGDGGTSAKVAGGKVAGCTGGAVTAGGAAPTRPRDVVGRVSITYWHYIGSTNLQRPHRVETQAQNQWKTFAQIMSETGMAGCFLAAEVLPWCCSLLRILPPCATLWRHFVVLCRHCVTHQEPKSHLGYDRRRWQPTGGGLVARKIWRADNGQARGRRRASGRGLTVARQVVGDDL